MFKSLRLQHILILLISVFFVSSCEKDPPAPTLPPTKPEVSFPLSTLSNGVDTIKDTYIFVRGIVKDTGRAPITDHGFIISTDTSALISNQSLSSSKITKVSLGPLSGTSGFSAKISGLIPNTRYSIASFATNSAGTGFATDIAGAGDIKFTTVKLLAIGDTYGGGKVAYLMQPGDTTYDANVQHGLIVSLADQADNAKWTNADTIISCSARGVNLLQGKSNTDSIIKYNPSPKTTAASIARAHRGGNYADWYLPSKNELNKLYINRLYIGGFANNYYWSSSEYDNNYAWNQNFLFGNQLNSNKYNTYYVRAIRAF